MTPRIAVVTPVYNTPAAYLEQCIQSVLAQTIGDWEWCIADDASTAPHIAERLSRLARDEPRVRITSLETNSGISGASNAALATVTAPILVLLDHDDELVSNALQRMIETFAERSETVYAYSDELMVDEDGNDWDTLRKPAWSPERLRWQMYCNHLSAYRTDIVRAVGGFRSDFDGAQDHDLLLRVSEFDDHIVHIPEILYRWHAAPHSTVSSRENKPHAEGAGMAAVRAHCERVGISCDITFDSASDTYRLRRRLETSPLVSIVIPTRFDVGSIHGADRCLVANCIESIARASTYEQYEIVIVQGEERRDHDRIALEALAPGRVRFSPPLPTPFNFSTRVNFGVAMAEGSYVILLNDDTEVVEPAWIESMIALAREPDVGAVGALLRFESGNLQHGGVFVHEGPGHVLFEHAPHSLGPLCSLALNRECLGVTGACLAVRKDVFTAAGGFTEALPSNWNDVDFCLKLQALGYRVLWTPLAELFHFESMSRDAAVTPEDWDALRRRWSHVLENDPYRTSDTCWVGRDVPMPRSRSPRDVRIAPDLAMAIDPAGPLR
jgi:GT2 family glycosyltransferase